MQPFFVPVSVCIMTLSASAQISFCEHGCSLTFILILYLPSHPLILHRPSNQSNHLDFVFSPGLRILSLRPTRPRRLRPAVASHEPCTRQRTSALLSGSNIKPTPLFAPPWIPTRIVSVNDVQRIRSSLSSFHSFLLALEDASATPLEEARKARWIKSFVALMDGDAIVDILSIARVKD